MIPQKNTRIPPIAGIDQRIRKRILETILNKSHAPPKMIDYIA